MSQVYADAGHRVRGKTSEHVDTVRGHFVELVRDERVVQRVQFESDDPLFAGAITMVATLAALAGGTRVTVRCENVSRGIKASDHRAGITSTLENLAAFTE